MTSAYAIAFPRAIREALLYRCSIVERRRLDSLASFLNVRWPRPNLRLCHRTLAVFLELLEEAEIAVVQTADVVHLVQHHSKALYPKTCGKSSVDLGVVAHIFQNVGVYHAAT